MTQRKSTILDKIGLLIPGYRGYVIRDEIRNTDKILRDKLSSLIQQTEKNIIEHQQQLIKNGEIQSCQEWEIARKSINTIFSKIKNAAYGESSFFSNSQLKENELVEIHAFDLAIAEHISAIFKMVENNINEIMGAVSVNQLIKTIDTIIINRTNFINSFR